jgi:hypothetical protein
VIDDGIWNGNWKYIGSFATYGNGSPEIDRMAT